MLDLAKLALILALTIYLLTRKWGLGLVLLLDAALPALLFRYPPLATLRSAFLGLVATDTLNPVGAVFLMLVLAELLRRTEAMQHMVASLQAVVPDTRVVLATIPTVIGLMPMLGGAMFSAPLVNSVGSRLDLSSARKTFVNYWSRHAIEYVWPLHTSVLITVALLEITPYAFITASYPLALVALIGGVLWGLLGIRSSQEERTGASQRGAWRDLLLSVWPLLLVILLVVVFRLPMVLSLPGVIVVFLLVKRVGVEQWTDVLRRSFPPRTFSAIVGVMILKRVIEDAGAAERIPSVLGVIGLPPLLVAFLVPHLIGLLTGTPPAAVALSIPLVAPLMRMSRFDYVAGGMWMFVGTFSGVLLSPLHLCLALTREYFGASWGRLYRSIVPATVMVVAVALGLVLLRSGA